MRRAAGCGTSQARAGPWQATRPRLMAVTYLDGGVGSSSTGGCVTAGPVRSASTFEGAGSADTSPPVARTLRVPSGPTAAVPAGSGSSVQTPGSVAGGVGRDAVAAAGAAGPCVTAGTCLPAGPCCRARPAGGLVATGLRAGESGNGATTTAGGGPASGTPARVKRRTVAGRGGGGSGTILAISRARASARAARASVIDCLAYTRSATRSATRAARGGRAHAGGAATCSSMPAMQREQALAASRWAGVVRVIVASFEGGRGKYTASHPGIVGREILCLHYGSLRNLSGHR